MDDQVKASVKALEEAVIPGETLSQPSSELLAIGRRVMSGLDALNNIEEAIKTSRWVTIVGLCQILAYANVNGDAEADITRWCEGQWTVITGRHPHNVLALQGLGHAWLLKAQPALASIYEAEGDLEKLDSGDSPPVRALRSLCTSVERNRRLSRSRASSTIGAEETARINSSNYAEARAKLRPALEAFDKAAEFADLQGAMTGLLLELAAQAYMSFGNVSHPRNNEICYQKAFRFLMRASQTPEFTIDPILEAFLEENRQSIGSS